MKDNEKTLCILGPIEKYHRINEEMTSMGFGIQILASATACNFSEKGYLDANNDVIDCLKGGVFKSGREHFEAFGFKEDRKIFLYEKIASVRTKKMELLMPYLRSDLKSTMTAAGKPNYLSAELIEQTKIVPTAAVSAHGYDFEMQEFILKYSNGLVLDCGAGSKANYLPNVVNFEIVDYPSTDILGVGEMLPFKDNTFDGVISVAVLEHVRDPFKCAQEISRVLKPGGKLYCAMPFLQPYHGYPHHYFNATHQGVMRLFEEDLKIDDVRVVPSTHPMHALHWILSSWKDGLSGNAKKEFEMMTVADFLTDIHRLMQLSFCLDLSEDKLKELACGTILRASKVCT